MDYGKVVEALNHVDDELIDLGAGLNIYSLVEDAGEGFTGEERERLKAYLEGRMLWKWGVPETEIKQYFDGRNLPEISREPEFVVSKFNREVEDPDNKADSGYSQAFEEGGLRYAINLAGIKACERGEEVEIPDTISEEEYQRWEDRVYEAVKEIIVVEDGEEMDISGSNNAQDRIDEALEDIDGWSE